MSSPLYIHTASLSLDPDLRDFVNTNRASIGEAIQLQMLRLLRGRVINVVPTDVEGWSPDGKHWYPNQPGTTGGAL